MIVLFARANHPEGWGGFPRVGRGGQIDVSTGAHGYVIIGVAVSTIEQCERVRKLVHKNGIWPRGKDPWYGGPAEDWDYLTTLDGDRDLDRRLGPSLGDNRYFQIYESMGEFFDAS